MSGISSQAQSVIDAVCALGIPRSEFRVRTQTRILRDKGVSYREYGDAVLITRSKAARLAVVEGAQCLADAGLVVTLIHGPEGRVTPVVSSGWNPRKLVEHLHIEAAA